MVPEQLLVSDSQAIRLQVRGQKHPLCHRPGPGPWAHRCLSTSVPWVCPGSWPGAPGPTRHLGVSSPPCPPRCPCLPGGQERSPGPHLLWSLEASASWDGGDGPRGPRPLCGMEPPAAACHVAQHVTALPCCLERSQAKAEAEPAPGGAGLGLSLTAPSQEPAQRGAAAGLRLHSKSGTRLGKYWWVRWVLQDPEGTLPGQGSLCRGYPWTCHEFRNSVGHLQRGLTPWHRGA